MFQWTRRLGARILDRLFLRSVVLETRGRTRELGRTLATLSARTERNHHELTRTLQDLGQTSAATCAALAELAATMEARHEAMAARLVAAVNDLRQDLSAQVGALAERQAAGSMQADAALSACAEQSARLGEALDALRRDQAPLAAGVDEVSGALAGIRQALGQVGTTAAQLQARLDTVAQDLGGRFEDNAALMHDRLEGLAGALDGLLERQATTSALLHDALDALRRDQAPLTAGIGEASGELAGVRQALGRIGTTAAQLQARLEGLDASTARTEQDVGRAVDAVERSQAAIRDELGSVQIVTHESRDQLLHQLHDLSRSLATMERTTFRQHEARERLGRLLTTRQPLPYTRGWAASPDLLVHLFELVRRLGPRQILELGSGISSVVMADALRQNGEGRLRSIDHDADFAAQTRDRLLAEDLGAIARVDHAPLAPWTPREPTGLGEAWEWYDLPAGIRRLSKIDLLVVDGPPGKTSPFARYPALPALIDRLAPGAVILLDDTIREEETRIAETWRDDFDLELVFRPEFEKGLAELTHRPAPPPRAARPGRTARR